MEYCIGNTTNEYEDNCILIQVAIITCQYKSNTFYYCLISSPGHTYAALKLCCVTTHSVKV